MISRARIVEKMDDPGLDRLEHEKALDGLARLNRLSRSATVMWTAIRRYCSLTQRNSISLLDVATGSGDVLLSLCLLAAHEGIEIRATGCDVSEVALNRASRRSRQYNMKANFLCIDALKEPLPYGHDVIVASLFAHHLSDDDVVFFLENAKQSTRHLLLISDLVRSRLNLWVVFAATRLLTRSSVVHFDGPASVCNSFTRAELNALAERACLTGAEIKLAFPCHMLLRWQKK